MMTALRCMRDWLMRWLAYFGQVQFVHWLVRHGADPISVDSFGENALFLAIRGKHPRMVKELLDLRPELLFSTHMGGHSSTIA
jgi:ankyrin repeat protein